MARKIDPRVERVVSMLPADGSPISHAAWREQIIEAREMGLMPFTQAARRAGQVIFEIAD